MAEPEPLTFRRRARGLLGLYKRQLVLGGALLLAAIGAYALTRTVAHNRFGDFVPEFLKQFDRGAVRPKPEAAREASENRTLASQSLSSPPALEPIASRRGAIEPGSGHGPGGFGRRFTQSFGATGTWFFRERRRALRKSFWKFCRQSAGSDPIRRWTEFGGEQYWAAAPFRRRRPRECLAGECLAGGAPCRGVPPQTASAANGLGNELLGEAS